MTAISTTQATRTEHTVYRGDIDGLRAVAVSLVVLYHAAVPDLTGGFVGVDVFFVISGYLITGILLREVDSTGRITLLGFYARRARRILPAATVVVVVTMFATYNLLGFLVGNRTAIDAQWAAIFSANIHLALVGTTYLGAQQAPSPLQHMWSLGVEEQFYLVWPTLVVGLIVVGRRLHVRHRVVIASGAAAVGLASFVWSVVQTSGDATWAYFSPLTRAWELAAGGLLAAMQLKAAQPNRQLVSQALPAVLGGGGLVAIVAAGFWFDVNTSFPSYRAALPVLGAVAVIAAGSLSTGTWVSTGLSWAPIRFLGRISYSLYLIHWPLFTIAAQHAGHGLSPLRRMLLLLVALALSVVSYAVIERPVRTNAFLARHKALCVGAAMVFVVATIVVAQWTASRHFGGYLPFHLKYS